MPCGAAYVWSWPNSHLGHCFRVKAPGWTPRTSREASAALAFFSLRSEAPKHRAAGTKERQIKVIGTKEQPLGWRQHAAVQSHWRISRERKKDPGIMERMNVSD